MARIVAPSKNAAQTKEGKLMKKPEPINKHVVCSVCGMDWEKHGEKPTTEKCVELLKAELARRPRYQSNVAVSGSGWYGNLTTQ